MLTLPILAFLAAAQSGGGKPPLDTPTMSVPAKPQAGDAAVPVAVPRLAPTRGAVPIVPGAASAVPVRPMQNLILPEDYPAAALAARQEGRTSYRLAIGPDGRVTGCVVLGSSGSSALDAATCRLLRARARFSPARDSSGSPTTDNYFGEYAWRVPR